MPFLNFNFQSFIVNIFKRNGVQGRLTPNMPFWHIVYFKLKLLKKQPVQEGYSDPHLPSWKQKINLLCERYIPCTRRKRHSYHQRQRIQEQQVCINKLCYFFTNLLPQAQTPFSYHFLRDLFFLCLRDIKASCFAPLLVLYFYELLDVQNQICFSPVNLSYMSI